MGRSVELVVVSAVPALGTDVFVGVAEAAPVPSGVAARRGQRRLRVHLRRAERRRAVGLIVTLPADRTH
ncbi:hypothetical protein [Actinosynnema sp. NPDC023587]|uniref:hypothetical protein n=1 Tax=Actinosynnema sp. NPDC023587 TaxID=3154695 RepID=UPI00341165EE